MRGRLERLEAPVLPHVKTDMLHKVEGLKQADGIHNAAEHTYAP
jgi:hypothetical protein